MLPLIFEKGMSKKNWARYFQIRKYGFFNIWKSDEQKIAPGVFRFVSMLWFNIWKSDEQKKACQKFKIRKYAFFYIWKSDEQKNLPPDIWGYG